MSLIGPTSGVTGSAGASRELSRADKRVRKTDAVSATDSVELDRAVQDVKSNDQEESREDHQQGGAYTQRGKRADEEQPPRLDVAG